MVSFVCDSEKSEMKVCFEQLHNVEDESRDFQWHGRTAVSEKSLAEA